MFRRRLLFHIPVLSVFKNRANDSSYCQTDRPPRRLSPWRREEFHSAPCYVAPRSTPALQPATRRGARALPRSIELAFEQCWITSNRICRVLFGKATSGDDASAFIHFACLFFLRGLWNGPPMEHRGHPSPCLNGALAVASFLVAGASTWFTRSEPAVPWRSSDRGCTFSDPARSPHLRICCTGLASENSSVTDAAAVICACRLLSRPCLEVRPTRDPVLA